MNAVRRSVAVVAALVSLLLVTPVRATSFSTDQSDLWYIPSEAGWGMQLVQRGSVIFATLFVYDSGATPIWYVATLNWVGFNNYSGALYVTNGPWFGTIPFNSSAVGHRQVGTMTWTADMVETGTLTYSVDGINVVKNVTRETLVLDDFSGHYAGGSHSEVTGCSNPALNVTSEAAALVYATQTQSTQAITIQTISPATGVSCSYPGTLSQIGQMGSVDGNFVCTDGSAGSFSLFEMQVNGSGVTSRFELNYSNPPGCHSEGWFGGVRGTTF